MGNKVCMEINPKHPIIKDLGKMVKGDKESEATKDYAMLLFDVAGLTSGYEVEDMSSFAKRVMGMMSTGSADAVAEAEIVVEVEKDEEEEKAVAEAEAEIVVEEEKDDDEEEEKAVEAEIVK